MGRPSCSKTSLLLLLFLVLLFSNGFGRKMMNSSGQEKHALGPSNQGIKSREMMELDYEDPGPNVNDKSGILIPSAAPPPPGLGY